MKTITTAIGLSIIAASDATAAEIGRGYAEDEIVLQGQIQPGDCTKLGAFLEKEGGRRVYLASPGGDPAEAMRIGRLIRGMKMSTTISGKFGNNPIDKRAAMHNLSDKANYMCASACFFAFVAGVLRSVDGFKPVLGIHRPYIQPKDLGNLTGDQALEAGHKTRAIVEAYLRDMDIPIKYVDRMYGIGGDEISWISEQDYEADLDGVVPDLRDWVTEKAEVKAKDSPNDK